ncbi:MAG: response regulator transcription factor [Candidatus Korobacteraceae bacterium]|jgi:two-component system nitrate/nitrite response regulator NarL
MPEESRNARILLVDDHALFRESVARFLDEEPGFEVVGGCGTVEEARKILQEKTVDLVLLDFDLGQQDGLDFMRVAEGLRFKGKVLLVTAGLNDADAANLLRKGIVGIFPKHNSPELLSQAIREALSGKAWFEQSQLQKIAGSAISAEDEPARSGKLTERERQVLSFVFDGLANKEIADQLQVSESSVKGTLQQLFQKTGARTRGQLVRIALEQFKDQL